MKKSCALILVFTLLLSLFPLTSWASSNNRMISIPTVKVGHVFDETTAPRLVIEERNGSFEAESMVFTLQLEKAEFLSVTDMVYVANERVASIQFEELSNIEYQVTVEIVDEESTVPAEFYIPLITKITGEGEVRVNIIPGSSNITGGPYVIAVSVGPPYTYASATSVPSVNVASPVNAATVRVDELYITALNRTPHENIVTLTLPEGFLWHESTIIDFRSDVTIVDGLVEDGESYALDNISENEATFSFSIDDQVSQRMTITLQPVIYTHLEIDPMDVTLEIDIESSILEHHEVLIAEAYMNYEEPVITNAHLSQTNVTGGVQLTGQLNIKSETTPNWINMSFTGPHGSIYGGGHGTSQFVHHGGYDYTYTWTDLISEYAPSGEYVYENISVKNESMQQSRDWPEDLMVTVETTSDPQAPIIESVAIDTEVTEEGTELRGSMTITSNSPPNWVNRSFYGPYGNIYGGGHGTDAFVETAPNRYEYTWVDTISPYAPSGDYYYENLSVGNMGMMQSLAWDQELLVTIQNDSTPQQPIILSVNVETQYTNTGTDIELTVTAESNSPVSWLNIALNGPAGNLYGGGYGYGGMFAEISPGTYEYVKTDHISKHAPDGTYAYSLISVTNEGMMASDVWPHDVNVVVEYAFEESVPTPPSSGGGGGGGGGGAPTTGTSRIQITGTRDTTLRSSNDDVEIQVPATAIGTPVFINIRPVNESAVTVPENWGLASTIYRITLEDGVQLEDYVTLTFNFDPEKVTDSMAPSLFWFDESLNQWVELENIVVDWDLLTVSGQIDHFTPFAVLAVPSPPQDEPSVGGTTASVVFTIDELTYTVNGVEVQADVAPYIKPTTDGLGRTMMPLRYVATAVGADKVEWDPELRKVTVVKETDTIELIIGEQSLKKNDEIIDLDVPAEIMTISEDGGRTMLPVAHLAQALGVEYDWVAAERSVYFHID